MRLNLGFAVSLALCVGLGLRLALTAALCDGEWLHGVDTTMEYEIHGTRQNFQSDYDKDPSCRFNSCPAQVFQYSCYMHGADKTARAVELEKRRFVPSRDSSCKPFFPIEFLELLRNKRLVMLGDSISSELFSSLFCTLYPLAQSQHVIWWHLSDRRLQLRSAQITFSSFNTSIQWLQGVRVDKFRLEFLYSRFALTQDDIVLLNYGLHYQDKNDFRVHMSYILKELVEKVYDYQPAQPTDAWKARLPPVFFMEATPQHFSDSVNGYFQSVGNASNVCTPLTNRDTFYTADWRNRVREEVFPFTNRTDSPVQVVPLVHGLWDQYDAHIGRYLGQLDCSHWCFPSGAVKFFHLMIHNALLRGTRRTPTDPNGRAWVTFDLRNGDLVKNKSSPDVFLIEGALRRPIGSGNALTERGFSLSQVLTVENEVMDMIPLGPPLVDAVVHGRR